MMGILKQIAAKNKAFLVINSCENVLQVKTAKRYIDRYNSQFEDLIGYTELMRELVDKMGDKIVEV